MGRRWLILTLLLLTGQCAPVPTPPVVHAHQIHRYYLPREAGDDDALCAVTPINVPFNDCRSVGEVRLFLRSLKAEP